jgi:tetratricopeptide (TPR) repeat protein
MRHSSQDDSISVTGANLSTAPSHREMFVHRQVLIRRLPVPHQTRTGIPSRRATVALLVTFATALLVAYAPALDGELLWDDEGHITRPDLRDWDGLRRIWFDLGATQQYYPVTHSTFWLQQKLWGTEATGYHVVNVLLHAWSALTLVFVLRRLRVPGAVLAGAIFALHPVHVESVAWISELKNVLSGLFYLAAAVIYLRFDERRERSVYVAALVLFTLALLSKTVTATLPGALLVSVWWRKGTISWRRDAVPLLPFLAFGAAAGLLTVWVEHALIGARGTEFDLTVMERLLVGGRAVWFYLAKLLWPANLSFNYSRWTIDASEWTQYLYPAAALGAALAAWTVRSRTRAPLAALLVFCGTLFPVLGIFNVYPFRYAFVADHFQYLASIPIIALASALIARALEGTSRRTFAFASVVLAAVLAGLTWRQAHAYADVETLYRTTLERNPESWLAQHNLGMLKLPSAPAEAVKLLQEAARIRPSDAQTRVNLGYALQLAGRTSEALAEYRAAIQIDPVFAEAHNNICSVLHQIGRAAEALDACAAALRIEPEYAKAHFNLGIALALTGRSGSIEAFREALRLDPASFDSSAVAELLNTLGASLVYGQHLDEGTRYFEEAVRWNPGNYAARFILANALQRQGRYQDSLSHYQRVLAANPRDAAARVNYGVALEHVGRVQEAIEQYKLVLAAEPEHQVARRNLTRALRRTP